MRSILSLVLALVVIKIFFPVVGTKLEGALIAFLEMAETVLSSAALPA